MSLRGTKQSRTFLLAVASFLAMTNKINPKSKFRHPILKNEILQY